MRQHGSLVAVALLAVGCASGGQPSQAPDAASRSAPPSVVATGASAPSPALSPTAIPSPMQPVARSVHLDWSRGTLPADDGCRKVPAGWACEDRLVAVFGGVALATPDASFVALRWEWTPDGRRWRDLAVPKDTEWLEPDGAGAFAFTEAPVGDTLKTAVWRSVDGTSWRRVADTSAWGRERNGRLSIGNGHYVITSNRHEVDEANRLFASADGWSWQEVPLPEQMAQADYVRVDGDEAGFLAQWRTDDRRLFSTSADGRTWSAPLAYPDPADMVYRVPSGLVGLEVDGTSDLRGAVEGGLVAAWTSPDGREWRRHWMVGQPSYEDDSMDFEARVYPVPGGFLLDLYQQDEFFFSADGVDWMPVNEPDADGCFVRDTPIRGRLVCWGDDWTYWVARFPAP